MLHCISSSLQADRIVERYLYTPPGDRVPGHVAPVLRSATQVITNLVCIFRPLQNSVTASSDPFSASLHLPYCRRSTRSSTRSCTGCPSPVLLSTTPRCRLLCYLSCSRHYTRTLLVKAILPAWCHPLLWAPSILPLQVCSIRHQPASRLQLLRMETSCWMSPANKGKAKHTPSHLAMARPLSSLKTMSLLPPPPPSLTTSLV